MGVITAATLIVLGVTTLIGTIGYAAHYATEPDRIRAKIQQLQTENQQLNSAKQFISELLPNITSAKSYLTQGKNDFLSGGHVKDNIPLANPEFSQCIKALEGAETSANNLIDDFNTTIQKNDDEIKSLQTQLQQLEAQAKADKAAYDAQMERRG